MKTVFHNPELRRDLLLWLLLTAAGCTGGFLLRPVCGLGAAALCLLFGLWHFAATRQRYRRLRALSQEIDRALLGQEQLRLDAYREGELSILHSELQKMTVRLRENAERLAQDQRMLRDWTADISHQLRTPLTSLNLVASMLSAPELEPEQRIELARQLRTLLGRIDWLIDTLLKLSRFDAGEIRFRAEPLRLTQVVARAAAPLAIAMELRGQTLSVTGDAALQGDGAWLAEAFGCLLKNCMEHTPDGGRIEVTLTQTALYAGAVIHDNGPGFDPADLPRLFERFYKGKNASANSFGIGLSLAQRIVTQHNGALRADNHPAGGARFTLRFYRDETI